MLRGIAATATTIPSAAFRLRCRKQAAVEIKNPVMASGTDKQKVNKEGRLESQRMAMTSRNTKPTIPNGIKSDPADVTRPTVETFSSVSMVSESMVFESMVSKSMACDVLV